MPPRPSVSTSSNSLKVRSARTFFPHLGHGTGESGSALVVSTAAPQPRHFCFIDPRLALGMGWIVAPPGGEGKKPPSERKPTSGNGEAVGPEQRNRASPRSVPCRAIDSIFPSPAATVDPRW